MTSDDRMTWGLIGEVLDVLERHGYHQYDNRHTAQAVGAIADLADLYDGARDPSYSTYLHQPPLATHAEPGPYVAHADDAVILTDIGMRDINGKEFCHIVKSRLNTFAPRVVAYTAFAMEEELASFRAAGFDAIVVKPATRGQILAAVDPDGSRS